jgi:ribonuclease P protein subunit POP4
MNVTPNIIRCEFIGTTGRVFRSNHGGYAGISGKITRETRNTFTILQEGKEKVVPKDSSVFHFEFYDGTIVEIHGKLLVGRPEDRLKKTIRRLW